MFVKFQFQNNLNKIIELFKELLVKHQNNLQIKIMQNMFNYKI